MPKPTSAGKATSIRVSILTMDTHFVGPLDRAQETLASELPGLRLELHAASEWTRDKAALAASIDAIEKSDIVICGMLFMEEHFLPVYDALKAHRDAADALVCVASASEISKLTHIGRLDMSVENNSGPMAFLKRLRGSTKPGAGAPPQSQGARQMQMLRRLPQILRFIPGSAQDLRIYFLTLQYWLAGSEENVCNMVRLLVQTYADGPRRSLRSAVRAAAPIEYPEVGVYHPRLAQKYSRTATDLVQIGTNGTVGLLVMRSYLLAGNSEHYDGVIDALEARDLNVVCAFASGLDMRPAIDQFFMKNGRPQIDALVSLSGFSLVGGPAYNDARAAETILSTLDVPYIVAHPVEFQTIQDWQDSERGLLPVESTMMVAIPELDGATGPIVFGGRSEGQRTMRPHPERCERLAGRVAKLVKLRRTERAARKTAVVLFNFPPNAGNVGTAAYLSVFQSLFNVLREMKAAGHTVDLPASVDALREAILDGNAKNYGANANVVARIPAADHVRRERYLSEIEAQWGAAPGRQQSDGSTIHVLGARFGNVLVGVQPSPGYEGDPMRLLFEHGFAPTHAFSAFYRYLREDFAADAVVHFGTHGSLEFMPGKQTGLSDRCWPDRLIADLPNIYLYASNNPSEGAIAKRRSAATLVSYLTPPVAHAGLYRGLIDLKASIERFRGLGPDAVSERAPLVSVIQAQASALELTAAEPVWTGQESGDRITKLNADLLELEYTLIPHGLHEVGGIPSIEERASTLRAVAESTEELILNELAGVSLASGASAREIANDAELAATPATLESLERLVKIAKTLGESHEIPALLRALDGCYIRPAPSGDLLRTPDILPTGRNLHGFDPFRIPSAFAVADGSRQAQLLIERHTSDGNALPETIAIVLWGTDNLKTEGAPIAQVLALLGAKPRFDSYGRLAGAALVPLAELARPRIDIIVTLSGIFRDLLPLQIRLLAEATYLAATASEPEDMNFVRKHALAYQATHGCDLETASLRIFGNAEGAYGSNVNNLLDSGRWDTEDEFAETFTRRKSFAYGRDGTSVQNLDVMNSVLAGVDLAYQNLDSVELGVTSIDTYFDTLGGISRAVRRAKGGEAAPVYISDQTPRHRRRAHLERAGLHRVPHPRPQSQVDRRHAQAWLRRCPPDRGPRHQHHGLVGNHRRSLALGLPTAHRNISARPRDARTHGILEPGCLRQTRQPSHRGARAQLLDPRPRNASGNARSWSRTRRSP